MIPPRQATLLRIAGVTALLMLLLAQMALSSARKSAAFDETYHLVSGYAYLHTGSPRLSWEHPPVPQVLAALPLAFRRDMAPFPTEHPGWQAGDAEAFVDDYLWVDNRTRAPELIWAGRWPLMLLTVAFGLGIFAALYTLAGEPAAWVGLVLCAFDPNVIANGRLVGNDLAAAGFALLAVWRLGAYLKRPTLPNLLLTGAAVGLAVSSKLTAAFLGPSFLIIAMLYPSGGDSRHYARRIAALAAMAAVAALTIWIVFGFEFGPLEPGGIPVPAPTYLGGLPRMFKRVARGTPTYLLGRVSATGWWYYFAVTLLLKTPLPALILAATGAIHAARRPRETALWWVPAGLYLLVASASTLQIGYRYVLPVLLFGIAMAAAQFERWPRERWKRWGLVALLAGQIVAAAWAFPDHLSYANLLAGGPDNAWRHFADMNVDWGTDLLALREYAAAHPEEEVYLAYFGSAYPEAYNLEVDLLPSFSRQLAGAGYHAFNPYTPAPGTYAISATSLHLGLLYEGRDLYAYFRNREPDARAGRSILIYRVAYPESMPVTRTVVVGPTVWRQAPEALGLGSGGRVLTKWSGAGGFVVPAREPAHYLVGAPVPPSPVVAAALAGKPLPWDAITTTVSTPEGRTVQLPESFGGGPALAGWELESAEGAPGAQLQLRTHWLVQDPLNPSMAAFVHLLGADGLPVTQWDGWPVAARGLEPGDRIVLEHPLSLPQDLPPGRYTLQVGLYHPPDGPRLPVAGTDRLILAEVQIEE